MALKRNTKQTENKAVAKAKRSTEKTSVTPPATARTPTKRAAKTKHTEQLTGEQLVVENLATLSSVVRSLSETLDVLVQKVENMAYHLIATEETLAEVIANTGVDLAAVNNRIRTKIAKGTDQTGDPSRAIDVAAAMASPAPKMRS